MRSIVSILLVGMLLFGLMGSAYASYAGWGLIGSPVFSVRDGSLGRSFLGGGPGSGK